jgi:flavin reductase (DIM6/NTAB) family NADH-FMN oxidoreductase RutF
MQFDMRALPKASRYKILGSCVTPRPIAWVTSLSPEGVANAAPYSFFNVLGDSPPTIALGLLAHGEPRLKDTAANIRATGEFVVNLVREADAAAMNLTCIDAPPEIDEIALAGLEISPSVTVKPPRIATAPASFECRVLHAIETGPHQVAVIAEVICAHVRDEFIEDTERLYFDTLGMNLLGRMHGAGWYSRQTDLIQLERPRWADLRAADGKPA